MEKRQICSVVFLGAGMGWRKAFLKCDWLDPHFLPFNNIDEIITYCIARQITVIVPISLKSHRFIINHQYELKKEKMVFMANNIDAVDCLGDKRIFYRFMLNDNLGSYVPVHYQDTAHVQYPCVVKKISGSFGRNQRIVHSVNDLGSIDNDELVMEYIEGDVEYATHILCNNGKVIHHTTLKHIFSKKYFIAGQARRKDIQLDSCSAKILFIFSKILEKFNYSGFCCVDYKIVDDKPIIFEINARMGFSLTGKSSELKKMMRKYIAASSDEQEISITDFQKDEIQSLMLFLSRVDEGYVSRKDAILYSDHYNPHSQTLTIEDFQCTAISNQDMDALQIVRHVNGSITLSDSSNLTRLDGLNTLRTISGQLVVKSTGIVELDGVNEMVEAGSLIISDNQNLKHINGFTGLKNIKDSLLIKNNTQLHDIHGINSLRKVAERDLEISGNPRLEGINGLKNIQTVGRSLILENCANLTTVVFLSSLKTVHNILFRRLDISSIAPLRQLFKNSAHFRGYIKILHCPVTDLRSMRGVKSVGSSFYLHNNQLSDLSGLEDLEWVGASFSLLKNRLKDISQLACLKEINGMLGLGNNQLVTLRGLENLEHIRTVRWDGRFCSLNISGNRQLRDISALSSLKGNNSELVVLMDKDQYFTCVPKSDSVFSRNTIKVTDLFFASLPNKLTLSAGHEDTRSAGGKDNRIHSVFPEMSLSRFPSRILEFPQVKNPIVRASDVPAMNGEFVADPFLFKEENRWHLFYEVMDKDLQHGVIGFSSSRNGLEWKFEKIILREDFHLSYPYVFRYNKKYYMIPESHQTHSVRLYEAVEFPYQWEYKSTLLSGKSFADPSIFSYQGKLWMFVSTSANVHCYLYYSDNLFNCWKAHPQSPVVRRDKSRARPAGRVFQLQDGRIIRTCQKCDVRYGQKVRVFEVTRLTEETYEERELPQSPIFSDTRDVARQHRMHHFDAVLDNNAWFIVTDRKGRETPWCIDLYTADSGVADMEGLKFLHVLQVTARNDNTDIEKKHFPRNVIEGAGKGFSARPPYERISKKSWSTRTIRPRKTHYFDQFPEPIILDFEFENVVSFDGIALWANRFSPGNSPEKFSIQCSCSGKGDNFSEPVMLTSCNPSPVNVELFRVERMEARRVRMKIFSNHHEGKRGGDRVGFHEIAFIGNYREIESKCTETQLSGRR